jgi:hypothetical protein
MSGDHNMYQKPRSYLDDFECPRCGHCCKTDLAKVGEVALWGEHKSYPDDEEPVIWTNNLSFDRTTRFFSQKQKDGDIPLFTTPFAWRDITFTDVFSTAKNRLTKFEDVWLGIDASVVNFAIDLNRILKEKNYG